METLKKKRISWLTLVIVIIILVDFFLFQSYTSKETIESNQEIYSDFGAPYAIQIYQGQYWGLLFNRFLHISSSLLLINVFAFLVLGFITEKEIGHLRFLGLILFASIFTSLMQLTLSNDAGIGFGTINFFLASYLSVKMFVAQKKHILFKIIFSISILTLAYLYYINIPTSHFGIEGMSAGWSLGLILGLFSTKKTFQILIIITALCISVPTLFYSPWSAEWNYSKGYEYHLAHQLEKAKKSYKKALNINPNHIASKENLTIIVIEELEDKALKAHENENYLLARRYYEELLSIDPNNTWAKENLSKLP